MGKKNFVVGAIVLVAGATLSWVWTVADRDGQATLAQPVATMPVARPPAIETAAAGGALPDFSALVDQCGPAVVNIRATKAAKEVSKLDNAQTSQIDASDPLFQLFVRLYGDKLGIQQDNLSPDHADLSVGSGFIISDDGYVLTNAHVVEDTDKVQVRLTDRREFNAKVVGVDRRADVAVLKIDAKNLPVVKIGDPGKSKVGQWVVAIGSPFDFENSVTTGIISAKARLRDDKLYTSFIQTDAPVNPGNSGGPLFNLKGEVIGINSWIYSRTGGFEGLSFSIPINMAMKIKDVLVKNGSITHIDVGVAVQPMDQKLAKAFGMVRAEGVLVKSVEPGREGDKAGMKPGDVVLAIAGRPVGDVTDVPEAIADIKPGMTVDVQVWRGRATRTLRVTAGAMPEKNAADDASRAGDAALPPTESIARLGLVVRALTPDEQNNAGVDHGLLTDEVSGPAQNVGVQAGDVILAVNGEPVSTPQALARAVKNASGSVAVLIQRDKDQSFVAVDLN